MNINFEFHVSIKHTSSDCWFRAGEETEKHLACCYYETCWRDTLILVTFQYIEEDEALGWLITALIHEVIHAVWEPSAGIQEYYHYQIERADEALTGWVYDGQLMKRPDDSKREYRGPVAGNI